MKLLEEGPKWNKKVTCNDYDGCGALLLIEKEDLFIVKDVDITGDVDLYYCVRCPVCNEIIRVKESEIPGNVKKEILNMYRDSMSKGK